MVTRYKLREYIVATTKPLLRKLRRAEASGKPTMLTDRFGTLTGVIASIEVVDDICGRAIQGGSVKSKLSPAAQALAVLLPAVPTALLQDSLRAHSRGRLQRFLRAYEDKDKTAVEELVNGGYVEATLEKRHTLGNRARPVYGDGAVGITDVAPLIAQMEMWRLTANTASNPHWWDMYDAQVRSWQAG